MNIEYRISNVKRMAGIRLSRNLEAGYQESRESVRRAARPDRRFAPSSQGEFVAWCLCGHEAIMQNKANPRSYRGERPFRGAKQKYICKLLMYKGLQTRMLSAAIAPRPPCVADRCSGRSLALARDACARRPGTAPDRVLGDFCIFFLQ